MRDLHTKTVIIAAVVMVLLMVNATKKTRCIFSMINLQQIAATNLIHGVIMIRR
jgi:hypothetical protein